MNVKGQLYWFRVLSRSARVVAVSAICMMGIGCASSIPPPPMKERGSIGAVDPERILKETKAGKDATELLNAFMKDRQALLELEQKELRRLEEEIMTQGSVLSPTARKQREERFRRRMMTYQQKVMDLNREIQEKQKELLDEFRLKVEAVVGRVAQKRQMSMVLEYGLGTSMYYHQAGLDLSDEVIREMDSGR